MAMRPVATARPHQWPIQQVATCGSVRKGVPGGVIGVSELTCNDFLRDRSLQIEHLDTGSYTP
jgi:hypothetical protein